MQSAHRGPYRVPHGAPQEDCRAEISGDTLRGGQMGRFRKVAQFRGNPAIDGPRPGKICGGGEANPI